MSFTRRFIDVTFSGDKIGTLTFNARDKYALRTHARILKAGGVNISELQLELRGLSLQHINQLSTFGTVVHPFININVKVEAGDDINGMSTVFNGKVLQAWADMKAMPDCPFHVVAQAGGDAAVMKADPTSFSGPTDAATMMKQIAGKAGYGFRNFGLNQKIADPYFWGSPWKQIREIADACNAECIFENNQLLVWPYGGSSDQNLQISPGNGLRDYPSWTKYGVQIRYEFHKAIEYRSLMTISGSQIPQANAQWMIIRIDYDLQSNTPHGQWFVILDGWDPKNAQAGFSPPIVQ